MAIDDAPRMADCFGVPTFYATNIVREDAGSGNVRIYNCILKTGILVPVCEVIFPADRMMIIGRDASDFATELHQRQMMAQIEHSLAFRH